ncbi:MAG: hypothetical protein JNM41_12735 [Flavipsychrobacter sp.]|nr:hypothetical protein [Flavipsychrobacter sp.]
MLEIQPERNTLRGKASEMQQRILHLLFYFGMAALSIGTLFKIQHWPYGRLLQSTGLFLEFLFFFFVLLEIILSKKAGVYQKLIFSIIYATVPLAGYFLLPALALLLVVFIAGNTYLTNVRTKFMFQMEKRK